MPYDLVKVQKAFEICNKNIAVLKTDSTLKEAVKELSKTQFGYISVKDDTKTVGTLSLHDIIKILSENGYPAEERVEKYMQREIVAIQSGAYVFEAMNLMIKHEVKLLLVLEEDKEIGILSFEDVLLEVQSELSIYFDNLKNVVATRSEKIDKLMNLKEEYLTIAAHDLKSPLSIIKGFAQILSKENNLTEEQKSCTDYISQQCQIMLEMITGLLDAAKAESGGLVLNKSEVDLKEFLKEIEHGFNILAKKKNISFVCECSCQKLYLMDKNKIRESIFNILENAFKFTKKGSIILSCSEYKSGIKIKIQDTGPGLSNEETEKIFNKYETVVKNKDAGSGLGLYIAHQIVKYHGGKIDVKSIKGKGSTFSIILP
jgi:signal transduction histidine kinase